MSAPPSYKEYPSQEAFDIDVKNISTEDKKDLLNSDDSDAETEAPLSVQSFNPSKSYIVNSKGIGVIRLPFPYNKELEIPITTPSGELAYISQRESQRSGNAVLSAPGRGDLIASRYRFGPGRDPKLELLNRPEGSNEVLVAGKWTSRSQIFTFASVPINFEWRYRREVVPGAHEETEDSKTKKTKKQTVLTLEIQGADKKDVTRIAMLVRSEETRTPGSKPSYAGNGGELRIDELAAKALAIPEELIIATCLMMLKKEVDRRRCVQWMMLASAVGA